MRQVGRYAKAVTRHLVTGAHKRTDAEVETLLAICKACVHFNGTTCGKCGCRCNAGRNAMTNKLRMSTEHCPDGKW